MPTSKKAPLALKIVAGLFFIGGVLAILKVMDSFRRNGIHVNFGVLGIFIGWGLLRFRRGWRTCALVFTWFSLCFLPVVGLMVISGAHPIYLDNLVGKRIGYASTDFALVVIAVLFVLEVWQYRVLTRSDVIELFEG